MKFVTPAHSSATQQRSQPQTLSPLVHLIDDDDAVRASLALLIGTVGLSVQTWGGGHLDEQCAIAGIDKVKELLK